MNNTSKKIAFFGAAITLAIAPGLFLQTPPVSAQGVCTVTGIETGQLALRFKPNGKSRAGLDNGNEVRPIRWQGNWAYVQVLYGPNSRINGLKGWVNSNYLYCG
ncbi:MAG: hypothetical protein HC903_25030 [Methylacidiphilales bacterium]|nr:hypothetical protein [Candidatus Methylacidiphilales bacterium]NJR16954.1 hypothetical protein [Calothrix sp. CSU_2_0]